MASKPSEEEVTIAMTSGSALEEYEKYTNLRKPWERFKAFIGRNTTFYRCYVWVGILTGFPFNLVVNKFDNKLTFIWCIVVFIVPQVSFIYQLVFEFEVFFEVDMRLILLRMYLIVVYFLLQIFSNISLWSLYYQQLTEKRLKNMIVDLFEDQDTGSLNSILNQTYRLAFCRLFLEMEPRVYRKLLVQRVLFLIGMPLFFCVIWYLFINTFEVSQYIGIIGALHSLSGITLAHSLLTSNAFCILWTYKYKHINHFIQLLEKSGPAIDAELECMASTLTGTWILKFMRRNLIPTQDGDEKDRLFLEAVEDFNAKGLDFTAHLDINLLNFVRDWFQELGDKVEDVSNLFSISFTILLLTLMTGIVVLSVFLLNAFKGLLEGKQTVDGLHFNDSEILYSVFCLLLIGFSVLLMITCLIVFVFDAANISEEAQRCSISLWKASQRMEDQAEAETDNGIERLLKHHNVSKLALGTMSETPTITVLGVIPLTKTFIVTIITVIFSISVAINGVTNSIETDNNCNCTECL